MNRDVVDLHAIDQTALALAGGKGANLGELARIDGVHVPPGVCVTTGAFTQIMASAPGIDALLTRLADLAPVERDAIRTLSAEIRRAIAGVAIPDDLAAAIVRALDDHVAYAVRSSATAEDLPTASFAGQQETYLNVIGRVALLQRISQCWASLFTERAVAYRARNGIDHRAVQMAVIVQRMVVPDVSGILFTADPVSGNRTIASIDASYGLGEALVSGLVTPDVYKVRNGKVIAKTIAAKQIAIVAAPGGGVRESAVARARQAKPALTDAQATRLAELGRRIEAHFGRPQDIEWCLVDDEFQIVQSRPITTLFPVPAGDGEHRVYLSTGHQQMMTDPISPLGLSLYQLTAARPMTVAGGRLFVDVTHALASPAMRAGLLDTVGKGDPHFRNALQTILDRGDVIRTLPDEGPAAPAAGRRAADAPGRPGRSRPLDRDVARVECRGVACDRVVVRSGPARIHPGRHW